MKKFLLIFTFAVCLFSMPSFAVPGVSSVDGQLGIKLGANFNQLNGGTWEKAYKPGVLVGAFGSIRKGSWGLRVEGLLNSAQYAIKDSITNHTWKALYLDIPVLLEYQVLDRLWLQGGVQISQLLSMTSDNSAIADPKKYFNAGDFNGVIGLEARLPFHITAGARYVLGVTNIRNESMAGAGDAWKTRTIQLSVGFRLL